MQPRGTERFYSFGHSSISISPSLIYLRNFPANKGSASAIRARYSYKGNRQQVLARNELNKSTSKLKKRSVKSIKRTDGKNETGKKCLKCRQVFGKRFSSYYILTRNRCFHQENAQRNSVIFHIICLTRPCRPHFAEEILTRSFISTAYRPH